MLTDAQILTLFFCFLGGSVLRTVWGYLWEVLEDPDLIYDHKYTATLIISTILTTIFAVTIFSQQTLPQQYDSMQVFSFISIGFTANSLFNSPISHIINREETE